MSPSVTAVLLAGGRSRRMGCDKAFLEIGGVPLWRRQIETLQALHPSAIFIAGPRHAAWIGAGCEIVADAQEDAGPLAALVASLRRCSTPLLLALAVDLPDMTADYLRAIIGSSSEATGVVPKSSLGFEPLAAVYPIVALPLAERRLRRGQHALQDFVATCVAGGSLAEKIIRPDEERLFRNLNTPADLSAVAL